MEKAGGTRGREGREEGAAMGRAGRRAEAGQAERGGGEKPGGWRRREVRERVGTGRE